MILTGLLQKCSTKFSLSNYIFSILHFKNLNTFLPPVPPKKKKKKIWSLFQVLSVNATIIYPLIWVWNLITIFDSSLFLYLSDHQLLSILCLQKGQILITELTIVKVSWDPFTSPAWVGAFLVGPLGKKEPKYSRASFDVSREERPELRVASVPQPPASPPCGIHSKSWLTPKQTLGIH